MRTGADDRWREAEASVRAQLGIRRPVRVLVTNHPALLVTWGAIAPVILLPRDAPELVRPIAFGSCSPTRWRTWFAATG